MKKMILAFIFIALGVTLGNYLYHNGFFYDEMSEIYLYETNQECRDEIMIFNSSIDFSKDDIIKLENTAIQCIINGELQINHEKYFDINQTWYYESCVNPFNEDELFFGKDCKHTGLIKIKENATCKLIKYIERCLTKDEKKSCTDFSCDAFLGKPINQTKPE